MRRLFFAIAVVTLAGGLLISSAATPGGDQVREDVVLSPAEGPNGAYAVMEDGELALRFGPSNRRVEGDGVSAGAVTPFNDVFRITHSGDEPIRVWLTADADEIRFYRGQDPDDGMIGDESAVVLEPNETVSVGVLIDTTDSTAVAADRFSIHAEPVSEQPRPTVDLGVGVGDGSDRAPTETETQTPTESETPTETEPGGGDGPDSGSGGEAGGPSGDATRRVQTPLPAAAGSDVVASDPGATTAATPASSGPRGFPWWAVVVCITTGLWLLTLRLVVAD